MNEQTEGVAVWHLVANVGDGVTVCCGQAVTSLPILDGLTEDAATALDHLVVSVYRRQSPSFPRPRPRLTRTHRPDQTWTWTGEKVPSTRPQRVTKDGWLTQEPKALLVVVEDERGRQWYRWAAGDMHTSAPWALLGAVHGDTVSNPDFSPPQQTNGESYA